mgnify:CR=1 FL=1
MAEGLRLKLWGPNGESREFELNDRGEVIRALTDWANEIGCGQNELDYQVNDGLRIMGDGNPYAGEVD